MIRDLVSLQAWRCQLRNVSPRPLPVVEFRLPELAPEQNRSFTLLASGYRGACGCSSSGLFMSVAVVATIISYLAGGGELGGVDAQRLLAFVGIVVVASLLGKLAGLAWARWQLVRLAVAVYEASRSTTDMTNQTT